MHLAVYAVFPYSRLGVKSVKTLKYIWSETVPKGTTLESSGGLTKVLVLQRGAPADPKAWIEERVNIADDYRRRFDDPPPKPAGIAVLTDSDDTASLAEGDYADFKACRS